MHQGTNQDACQPDMEHRKYSIHAQSESTR